MGAISTLLPLMTPQAGQAPEPLQVQRLQEAARDFCLQTGVWKSTETWESEADEDTYALTAPADGIASAVLEVRQGDVVYGNSLWSLAYADDGEASIVFEDAMAEDGLAFAADVLWAPVATTLPDLLLAQYGQAIVDGALWLLYRGPGPWRDPQVAMEFERAYMRAIGDARRLEQLRRQGNASVRMRDFV